MFSVSHLIDGSSNELHSTHVVRRIGATDNRKQAEAMDKEDARRACPRPDWQIGKESGQYTRSLSHDKLRLFIAKDALE